MALQAPLPIGFPRQEYWSGLSFPYPGDLPNPGIKPMSPALQVDSFLLSHLGNSARTASLFSCLVMSDSCNPMNYSMPGFPVVYHLPEFSQTHVHWVSDATLSVTECDQCAIHLCKWHSFIPFLWLSNISLYVSGRSCGEGNGNPLQYSCLENPMDREAWLTTVHGITKIRTRLSDFTFLCVLHLYPFLCWWTFSFFHVLAIVYSATMNKHRGIFWNDVFFQVYAQECDCWIIW